MSDDLRLIEETLDTLNPWGPECDGLCLHYIFSEEAEEEGRIEHAPRCVRAREALAAVQRVRERVGALEHALVAMARLAPTGAANVHEEAERQRVHQDAIALLGLVAPGKYVPSHYWVDLEGASHA